MIITIEEQYTGEITRDEVMETQARIKSGHYSFPVMSGALQGFAWMQAATPDELQAVIEYYAPLVERAMRRLDDANRFRPSYAPAGRPTREQEIAKIEAQRLTRTMRCLIYKCAARRARGM